MLALAAAARHRRGALRRRHRADDAQRRAVRPVARRDRVLLHEPAPAPQPPSAATRPADGARAPWYPVRLLPAQPDARCSARGSSTSRRRTTTGSRSTSTPPRTHRGDRSAASRCAVDRDRLSRGTAASRCASLETPDAPWTLSLRIPGWCRGAVLSRRRRRPRRRGRRAVVELERDLAARATGRARPRAARRGSTPSDPRVDAIRGCVAFERGPLVYCIETRRPARRRVELEDVEVGPGVAPDAEPRDDLAAGDRRAAPCRRRVRRAGAAAGADARAAGDPVLRVGEPAGRGDAGVDPDDADRPARDEAAAPGRLRRAAARSTRGRPAAARTRPWPARGRRSGIAGEVDRGPDGLADHLGDRHPERGERRHRVGGDQDVVEADHRQPLGDGRARGMCAACSTPMATRSVEVHTAVGGSGSSNSARSASSPPASVFAHALEVAVGDAAEALGHELDVGVLALRGSRPGGGR